MSETSEAAGEACHIEDVDGLAVRVKGAGEWDDTDRAMFADVVQSVRRRVEAEARPDERTWTERDMLDLIRARYAANSGNGPRYVVAEHVRNQGGFGGYDPEMRKRTGRESTLRTADALAIDLWPSSGHMIHGFEVKVSRSDWLTELRDPEKCEAFKLYAHHWWLVAPVGVVRDDLPDGWGLLSPDSTGRLRVKRRAPRLDPEPVPLGLMAAWLRAATKTALRSPTPARPASPQSPASGEGGGAG